MVHNQSDHSLEVLRMPGGEPVRQRVAVINVAPEYLKNALLVQMKESEKQKSGTKSQYPAQIWDGRNYVRPVIPESQEVRDYADKLRNDTEHQVSNPLMQEEARGAIDDFFNNNSQEEVSYDI